MRGPLTPGRGLVSGYPFRLERNPCGLSRQQPDQIDEASIGRRRRRHSRFAGRAGDHTKLFDCCTFRSRYDRVPVLTRNTPFRDNDARSQCFDKMEILVINNARPAGASAGR